MGHRGNLVPGQSLCGVVVAIVGTYSNSSSEAAQISEGSYSTTAHPDTCWDPTQAPRALQHGSTTQQG